MRLSFQKYAGIFCISVLIAIANLYLGQHEIGGYDLSSIIDSGWRLFIGQSPGRDFICTLPPSLYLFTRIAFGVFGVRWASIFIAQSALYLVLVALGLRLCWILKSVSAAHSSFLVPAIYVVAQSAPTLAVNHIYHSTTASTFAAYAILAAYVLTHQLPLSQRREVVCHLTIAFAVLLISKPNTAWPAVLICAACLLRVPRLRAAVIVCLVAAVLTDVFLLRAFHIGVFDAFAGYAGLSGRAVPKLFIVGIYPDPSPMGMRSVFLTYFALCIPIFWIVYIAIHERRQIWASPSDLLCIGAALISFAGFGTNWDLKISDLPPILVGLILLAMTSPERQRLLVVPLEGSSILLVLVACWLGIGRIRMECVGPWAGPGYGQKVEIHDAFFGDFVTRQFFRDVLNEVDVATAHSAGKTIFFGPRMEFLYAREGLSSPTHLPPWWHPGSSYPLSSESEVEQAWEEQHFDVLIFPKYDRTRIPLALLRRIDSEYRFDGSQKAIDIFYRK